MKRKGGKRRGGALAGLGEAGGRWIGGGELGGLGDVDVSSLSAALFRDRSQIDAESDAFDAKLNAWLLDYSRAAASLPAAFVQQVDAFVFRWRDIRSGWYFVGANLLNDIVNAEAEWNRLRDQFLSYGKTTAIGAATVSVNGAAVRADQIPPEADWFSKASSLVKWGAVIVGGVIAVKVASDLGVVAKIGSLVGTKT